ncbi:hypothetical protein BC829DRAFT_442956 [Chytridium lagenaria]|nr:hypothetical protein BC829DRAFT_442956 [Chytridium lagenaria]
MTTTSSSTKEEPISPWNKALPYDILPHQDAYLDTIRQGLQLAILAQDYDGSVVWAKNLNAFISLKYHMKLEDRLFFVKSLYAIATADGMNLVHTNNFAATCAKLLKSFAGWMLEVQWKPLWMILRRVFFPRGSERVLPADANNAAGVVALVKAARRFFTKSSTAEILEELLPDINPHNIPHMFKIVGMLNLFLPTDQPPAPLSAHKVEFYWIPTLFSLWSLVGSIPKFTVLFLDIFSRLTDPHPPLYTPSQLQYIFTAGLLLLEIPVGNDQDGGGMKVNLSCPPVDDLNAYGTPVEVFARFVVANVAKGNGVMELLGALVKAVEGFYNPSNFGKWSFKLGGLLRHLSGEFLKRWKKEQKQDCKTPIHLRLTDEIKKEFVGLLRGPAYLAMFGKHNMLVHSAASAIQKLCMLEPDMMIPRLLERIYPALENLTEVHRTSSSIAVLGPIASTLISRTTYPSGAQHTSMAAMFINNVLMMVPVWEVVGGAGGMETELEEGVRLSTAEFGEWGRAFLERVFVCLENLPQNHGSAGTQKQDVEGSLLSILAQVCEILFVQSSPEISKMLLNRLSISHSPYHTNRYQGYRSISSGPEERFHANAIKSIHSASHCSHQEELEHGASSTTSLPTSSHPFAFANMSDANLHWNQSILMNVVSFGGECLLKHKATLVETIRLQISTSGLTFTYPENYTSVDPAKWRDDAYMRTSHQHWGEFENCVCEELMEFYVGICEEKLRGIVDNEGSMTSDGKRESAFEMCRWITVARCSCRYIPETHPEHHAVKTLRERLGRLLDGDVVKCVVTFLANRGVEGWKVGRGLNEYRYMKKLASGVENGKRHPRFLIMQRVANVRSSASSKSTPHRILPRPSNSTHRIPYHKTLHARCLAIPQHPQLRQDALGRVIAPYPQLKQKVFVDLLTQLQKDGIEDHVAEGVLMCMRKKTFVENFSLRAWGRVGLLFDVLSRPLLEVKPNILELKRKLFLEALQLDDARAGEFLAAAVDYVKTKNTLKPEIYSNLVDGILSRLNSSTLHWRSVAMSVNLLELIVREDVPVKGELVGYTVQALISEHPTARTVSLSLMKRLLVILKRRAKKSGVSRTKELSRVVGREMEESLETDRYLRESVEESGVEVMTLHDSNIVGWYCWPKEVKLYREAPPSFDAPAGPFTLTHLPFHDPSSSNALQYLLAVITQPSFWVSLASFFSLETSRPDEPYNPSVTALVRLLASQYEDRFLDAFVGAVEPMLLEFGDRWKQKAACEMVAGLVRGMKHWTRTRRGRVWGWLTPLLGRALQGVTVETLGYWGEFISNVCASRDIRRVLPLVDAIFSWKLDPTSTNFFMESKKLLLLRVLYSVFNWRLSGLTTTLLRDLLAHIRHPFKQVREALGSAIDDAIHARFHVSATNVEELLLRNLNGDGVCGDVVPKEFDEEVRGMLGEVFENMKCWRMEEGRRSSALVEGDYVNASKTFLSAFCTSTNQTRQSHDFSYLPLLYPELLHMLSDSDPDLQSLSTIVTNMYPTQLHPPLFRPRHTSSPQYADRPNPCSVEAVGVVDGVAGLMMADGRVEVRQMAGVTLSGLVRCSQREAVDALKAKFYATLKSTKPAKKRSTLPALPDWMPEILVTLAGCVGDLAPVSTTVSKMFSEFRRTQHLLTFRLQHQDTWREDMLKFDEDQLSVLSDLLISASYYA